jgi:6-phosphogluconolactonase/glucosamine-6-phosphate isomerase/deaminase
MMANGKHKADIIKKILEEPIHTDVPANIIRTHQQALVMLDREAASLLNKAIIVCNEIQ